MSISDRQVSERQCKRALVSAEGYLILRRTILNRDLAGRFVGLVALLAWTLVAAEPRLSVFDPTAYGAKGDGRTNDGPAIQKAIDACARAGGGTVCLPAGNFLSGTLVLKSNVTLHLTPGATLQGSRQLADYGPLHLIYAQDAENIGLEGEGTIDGSGEAF